MVVGIARLRVRIPENRSLKGKRKVIKSLIGRVNSKFNVAISEVDCHDLWQMSEIGISVVGNNQSVIDSVLNRTLNFIEATCLVEIINTDIEIIHFS